VQQAVGEGVFEIDLRELAVAGVDPNVSIQKKSVAAHVCPSRKPPPQEQQVRAQICVLHPQILKRLWPSTCTIIQFHYIII
jgi:hypothetical protein